REPRGAERRPLSPRPAPPRRRTARAARRTPLDCERRPTAEGSPSVSDAAKKQPAKPARRSRGSLSEEEIVSGAIALVKRDGLEGLSMPNLARHLGAGVMSLYWYFHSKDELLAAMAERTMREIYARLPAVGDGPWDKEIVR